MFHSTYAFGFDFGNSETTGYTQIKGDERTLTLPSALYSGSYDELMRLVGATSSNDGEMSILNAQSHTLKFRDKRHEERELYVGELAIKQAGNTTMDELTGRGLLERYWDYRSLSLLLSTSGTLIPDAEYGLLVVTNIPVASHTKNNTDRVKITLEGDYDFMLDGRQRTAHITVKKVLMEGASVNILWGDGKRKMGVVDIGGRSMDLYRVDGLIPKQDLCKSFEIGVETASDRLKERFEKRFEYPISVADTGALMQSTLSGRRYHEITSVRNSGVHSNLVEKLVNEVLSEVGQDIASHIGRVWGQSFTSSAVAGDVAAVFAIGGGAYYFEGVLRGLFGQRLQVPPSPEQINAYGCFHLARAFLAKEQTVTKVVG